MKLLGARVVPVESGSKTLKDALNEAMRDWVTNVENTFYIIGTVAGPHPYPMMVRDFNAVVGRECRVADAAARGSPAGRDRRVRRRRQQRDGHLPRLRRRPVGPADRRRGGRRRARQRASRGEPAARLARRAARQPHVHPAGRQRADHRDAFDLGRPRLSGRRSRARMAEGHRPRGVRRRDRRRGARGLPRLLPHRRHHPGARVEPRAGVCRRSSRRRCARDRIILVNLSGRGDKDLHIVSAAGGT